jgi:hypothetical protein
MAHEFEEDFMRANALRHVLLLTYRVSIGDTVTDDYASCFVVEIRGTWILVTAGHVILDLRRLKLAGASLTMFQLIDAAAGAGQPAYPISMDVEAWAAIDDAPTGLDLAALVINDLSVMALRAANVLPIGASAIVQAEFSDAHQLVLVGAPAERFSIGKGGGQMRMSLIPIVEAQPSDDMPVAGTSILGQIVGDPQEAELRVQSVKGMSGCPVFMVQTGAPESQRRYWAVGVQSSWNARRRVVRISQLQPLVEQLERHFGPD